MAMGLREAAAVRGWVLTVDGFLNVATIGRGQATLPYPETFWLE